MQSSVVFSGFRKACARLARPGGTVDILVGAKEDGSETVNVRLHDDNFDREPTDYRQVHPDWLSFKDDLIEIDLWVARRGKSSDKTIYLDTEGNVFLDSRKTRRLDVTKKVTDPRKTAIAKFGEDRVTNAEKVVHDTVKMLVKAPGLKAAGYLVTEAPKVRMSWSVKRSKSRGGKDGISLAMRPRFHWSANTAWFREYKSFAEDPDIGTVQGTVDDMIRVLVAHEMAHWIQYAPSVKRPEGPAAFRKPHGEGFKIIYRILRRALVSRYTGVPYSRPEFVAMLAEAFKDVGIERAFVFGSEAKGKARPRSDLDIIAIGKDLNKRAIMCDISLDISVKIGGREVNVLGYTPEEWQELLDIQNRFATSLEAGPRIEFIGPFVEMTP